jgi:hypothetical protein
LLLKCTAIGTSAAHTFVVATRFGAAVKTLGAGSSTDEPSRWLSSIAEMTFAISPVTSYSIPTLFDCNVIRANCPPACANASAAVGFAVANWKSYACMSRSRCR